MNTSARRSGLARLLPPLLLLAAVPFVASCSATAEGKKAPPVTGDAWLVLEGSDASAVIQGKWALVVFFRSDFARCREQVPEVKALREAYGPAGLVVVGVTPEEKEPVREFVGRYGVEYPVLAEARSVQEAWGILSLWENRYYVVDPDGTVVAQDDLPAIRRILDRNLLRKTPERGDPAPAPEK